jgi:hypothetical protein
MSRTNLVLTLFVASVLLITSAAFAQEGMGHPGATPSNAASASFTSASSGRGRGIGVGAVTMLNGTSGGLVTWGSPGGGFHIDGFFGLHRYHVDNGRGGTNTTSISVGGRFWYHVHAASFADFSLGGGLGYVRWRDYSADPSKARNDLSLEVGGQIRAFIVPNVALLADLGLGAVFGENDNIMVGGQSVTGSGNPPGGGSFVEGTLGIAYFFE